MRKIPWRHGALAVVLVTVFGLIARSTWAGRPVTVESLIQLLVFALPVAGIYAISATGLVVVHSATGIFNFAQGAMGMVCAFVFWEISVNRGVPVPLALILVIGVFAPLFGYLLERYVMRHLKHAPLVAQLVGSVGVLIALLGIATLIWNPNNPYPIQGLGGSGGIEIADVTLTWHRVITIATAVVLAVSVQVLLRRTRLGISMRAVVDNEDVAALYGVRPGRVSATAWIIGAVSAALAGILIAPEVGNMGAETLSLLIVNAFAAAVFGRLRSLSMTYLGALLLGLLVTFTSTFLEFGGRWNLVPNAIPALALFVVLLFLPQPTVKMAGAARTYALERLPSNRSVLGWAVILLALATLAGFVASTTIQSRLITALSIGVILLGLVPLMGWAGIPVLAPYALGGVGAAITYYAGGSILALIPAALGTAAFGVVFALPALRLRELYLALSSIALALIATGLILVQPEFFAEMRSLPPISVAGIDLSSPQAFLIYAASMYLLVALGLVWMRRTAVGRRLVALRDSEAAAACVGVNVARQKAFVFAIAGGISGVGGGVLVQGARVGSVDQFSMVAGLGVVLALTIWGVGTVSGPLVAGLMAVVFTTLAKDIAPGTLTHGIELLGPALAVLALGDYPRGQIPLLVELVRHRPWHVLSVLGGVAGGITVGVVAGLPGLVPTAMGVALGWLAVLVLTGWGKGQLPVPHQDPAAQSDLAPATGVDRPFDPASLSALDRVLGVREVAAR
ncbi:ABC transporter permease [Nocardioides sp. LHG3406-4]|uniref:ABC transporter permease n=1 Tax=Nocardioides sp. LHG3406-4 TaxID=2804575 RepID=UPI003CE9CEB8